MKTKTRYTLWSVTRGQRWRYLGAVLAMGLTNLFIFGPVLVSGGALDVIDKQDFAYGTPLLVDIVRGLAGGDSFVAYLWVAALAALLMTGFGGVFLFARGRFAAVASEAIVRGLRERLYARLHDLHSGFYDTADTGDLVQRASSDVETLRVFLASDVVEIGRAIMLLLCVTPILVWLEPRLAALSLCLMPFLAAGAYVFFSRVKDVFLLTDESEAAMTAVLQENLTGIRVVRAFARTWSMCRYLAV